MSRKIDDVAERFDQIRRDLLEVVLELRGVPEEQRRLARKVDEVCATVERLAARMDAVDRRNS